VNVRHARLYEFAVRAMRKKLKLVSDGIDSGSKKCKRGYGGACSGVWRSLESGGRFCVGAFGRNPVSIAVKMFSHLICYFKKLFYCFAKVMLEQIVLLFSTKKRFIPVNFDGSYYANYVVRGCRTQWTHLVGYLDKLYYFIGYLDKLY
jgi:hypothetical protein